MRGKSVLLLVIALVCGAVASVGMTQMLNKPAAEAKKAAMVKVYVALDDIDINEELTADNIRLEEWPQDRVPEGAITKLEAVEGKFAMHRLFKTEPIVNRKISDKRIGTEEKIPEGYRAFAVRTSAQSAVSNLLLPGSRVDVICYLKAGDYIPRTMTRTILKDIRVFSVNANTTRETEGNKGAIDAKTVTLLVKPTQVELLTLASQLGTIQFAMRKPDDVSDDMATTGTTAEDLLGNPELESDRREIATTPAPAAAPTPDFREWLEGKIEGTGPTQPVSIRPVEEMVVIQPNGPPKRFQWNGIDELPQEVAFGMPAAGFGAGLTTPETADPLAPPAVQPQSQSPKDSSEGEGNAEGDDRDE